MEKGFLGVCSTSSNTESRINTKPYCAVDFITSIRLNSLMLTPQEDTPSSPETKSIWFC